LNHYELLGVDKKATEQEIGRAFRQKSMDCHPDKFPNDAAKAAEMKALSQAKTMLLDPAQRETYDKSL
ncbi:DnaJ domain-containing protein, partial [Podospora didyma]